jgi:hypothetical protein
VASRTQILCLCEGAKSSIDSVFIRHLIKKLNPKWIRPWDGNNAIRIIPSHGRAELMRALPTEFNTARSIGSSTAIMVWADLDNDCSDGDQLKRAFKKVAKAEGMSDAEFESIIFAFAKDRMRQKRTCRRP